MDCQNKTELKKNFDENADNAELMKKCRKYFLNMDKNGDGKLNVNEFDDMMRHAGISLNEKELRQVFMNVDTDKSGIITFNEFLKKYGDSNLFIGNNRKIRETSDTLTKKEITEADIIEGCRFFWKFDSSFVGKLSSNDFAS